MDPKLEISMHLAAIMKDLEKYDLKDQQEEFAEYFQKLWHVFGDVTVFGLALAENGIIKILNDEKDSYPSIFEVRSNEFSNHIYYISGSLNFCSCQNFMQKAEKNDAAKNVANLLSNGRSTVRNTRSLYNKLYIFDSNFRGNPATFVFTSVSGHIMQLEFEAACRNWEQYPIDALFDARIQKTIATEMKDIELTLKDESRKASVLIIWTDCDREGENIGAEIIEICTRENPRLEVYRAHFSELTKGAVERAMRYLGQIDMNKSNAVDCRQEIDLRTGAIFTRQLTMAIKKSNVAHILTDKKVVSYGSCQFPTLGFVVERYKANRNFRPEKFWKLIGKDQDSPRIEFLWDRGRVFEEECAKAFKELCQDESENVRVIEVQQKPKSKWRPLPMNTVELEKRAIRQFRMNGRRVINAAEKLYTKGYISYPRTETTIFPKDLDYNGILDELAQNNHWSGFVNNEIRARGGPNPRNGRQTDNAHPPIHPVRNVTENELGGRDTDEWKIYELVTRHFLACISRDATGQETKVKVQCGEFGELFTATGLKIEDRGYLLVYLYESWSDKLIPGYILHQKIKRFVVTISEGMTSAPKLLTEADLIGLMDKFGIGTDATHAEHVDKIKQRGYVIVNPPENRFLPTELGISLVEGYQQMGIKDNFGYEMDRPKLRADFERDLVRVSQGEIQPQQVRQQQINIYKGIYNVSTRQTDKILQCIRDQLNQRQNNQGLGMPH